MVMRVRKRSPRVGPAGRIPGQTTPEKNDATTGTEPEGRAESYARLRLPHERDEDVTSQVDQPRPIIRRAADDLAEGKVDTDCYGQARINFLRRERKRRP
jgi:hypothetical protein